MMQTALKNMVPITSSKKYKSISLTLLITAIAIVPEIFSERLKASDVFKVCHSSAPDYNNCVTDSLYMLKPSLIKGIPKLKIPPVEPMVIPRIQIRQGSGPVSIDSTFTNQRFYGITNYTIKRMKADPENYRIEFDVFLPWLYVEGDYAIKGQMLVLPISGSGDSWSNYTTVDAKVKMVGHPETRQAKKYFVLDDFRFNVNVKSAKVQMNNLFNGNKQLGDTMNQFMSDNWEVVFQELKPVVDESISVLIKDIAGKVFNKFPYDELFPK